MTVREARQIVRELMIALAESGDVGNNSFQIIPTPIEWKAIARLVDYEL